MPGRPQSTRARLNFEAGKIVMLELGSDGQVQTVRHNRNFILNECAVERQRSIRGKERNIQRIFDVRMRDAETDAPDDFLAVAPVKSVLKIDISRVALLAKDWCFLLSPVVIRLERQL